MLGRRVVVEMLNSRMRQYDLLTNVVIFLLIRINVFEIFNFMGGIKCLENMKGHHVLFPRSQTSVQAPPFLVLGRIISTPRMAYPDKMATGSTQTNTTFIACALLQNQLRPKPCQVPFQPVALSQLGTSQYTRNAAEGSQKPSAFGKVPTMYIPALW